MFALSAQMLFLSPIKCIFFFLNFLFPQASLTYFQLWIKMMETKLMITLKTTASDPLIRGNSGNHLGEETVCPKDLDLDSDF